MLPSFVTNAASLSPGVDRWAMSVVMEMDQNGKIVDYRIQPTAIHSVAKLTYQHAQGELENCLSPNIEKKNENLSKSQSVI